jgi:hypothetical protein
MPQNHLSDLSGSASTRSGFGKFYVASAFEAEKGPDLAVNSLDRAPLPKYSISFLFS